MDDVWAVVSVLDFVHGSTDCYSKPHHTLQERVMVTPGHYAHSLLLPHPLKMIVKQVLEYNGGPGLGVPLLRLTLGTGQPVA